MHAKWEKKEVILKGQSFDTLAPVIISASRATDIPAFHLDSFERALKDTYMQWRNPFNGAVQMLSFDECALIVFWSKNPSRLLQFSPHSPTGNTIDVLIHYTCNDYEAEGYEPGLPPLRERIALFEQLSAKFGRHAVIWRFDPLLLSDRVRVDMLCDRMHAVAAKIAAHVSRMIFSFIEIEAYAKVQRRITRYDPSLRLPDENEKKLLLRTLADISKKHALPVSCCASNDDYSEYGITKRACIDYTELRNNYEENLRLQRYLNSFGDDERNYRHKGQRKHCLCTLSKDIGTYNTCSHNCIYCYANR